MYTSQAVRSVREDRVSKEFLANNRVRQGGVLSPVLFTLYIETVSAGGRSRPARLGVHPIW